MATPDSPFTRALVALSRYGVDFVVVGVGGIKFYALDHKPLDARRTSVSWRRFTPGAQSSSRSRERRSSDRQRAVSDPSSLRVSEPRPPRTASCS